jgi:hypothetical protein
MPVQDLPQLPLRRAKPHRQAPFNKQEWHFLLVTGVEDGIRLDIHLGKLEDDLPRQTLADSAKVIPEVTTRPGVEFEAQWLERHRDTGRTLPRPLGGVNAASKMELSAIRISFQRRTASKARRRSWLHRARSMGIKRAFSPFPGHTSFLAEGWLLIAEGRLSP